MIIFPSSVPGKIKQEMYYELMLSIGSSPEWTVTPYVGLTILLWWGNP